MLITFTGRKTGKQFTTPVTYLQNGNRVVVFTTNRWWKNLTGGASVTLVIRGKVVDGFAVPNENEATILEKIKQFIVEKGMKKAWMIELNTLPHDRSPTHDELMVAARRYVVIEIQITSV